MKCITHFQVIGWIGKVSEIFASGDVLVEYAVKSYWPFHPECLRKV